MPGSQLAGRKKMKRSKSLIERAAILAAVLGAGVLALSSAEAATTLEFWTWNNEGDYVKVDKAAVSRFEAAHPDVKVEVTYTPYGDYMTKLKAALAANQPPD